MKHTEDKLSVIDDIAGSDDNAVQEQTVTVEKDDELIELVKALAFAAILALTIRTFLFEPFNIPSGSMLPTLQVGDYLFVEKYSYGYGQYSFPMGLASFEGRLFNKQPARGDIAVFRKPKNTDIDYIKRIVGLPGDKIQVIDGILHINGEAVRREFKGNEYYQDEQIYQIYTRYLETLPTGVVHPIYEISDAAQYDETREFTVPEGYYFAMGDNRDSSLDSRAQFSVGFIPAQNLIGRAWFIFFSLDHTAFNCHDEEGYWGYMKSLACHAVLLPGAIRYNRIFNDVHKIRP